MSRTLATYVWLRDPSTDEMVSLGPADTLPGWAEAALKGKDHLFGKPTIDHNVVSAPLPRERGVEVDYVPDGKAVGREPAATEEGAPEVAPIEDELDQPKGNASREAWAIFATENGVPITDEMGRDDIKSAAREAGVID